MELSYQQATIAISVLKKTKKKQFVYKLSTESFQRLIPL